MKTKQFRCGFYKGTIRLGIVMGMVASGHCQTFDWSTIAGGFGGSFTRESADGTNNEARFCRPHGVALDSNGNVYVVDTSNDTIRKLAPLGADWVVTTIAGLAGAVGTADGMNSEARFNGPLSLAAEPSGVLYVVDSHNSTIRKLMPLGTNWVVTTIAGLAGVAGGADGTNDSARFNLPIGITLGTDGALYVSDPGNFALRKLTPVGTNWVVTTIATFGERVYGTNGLYQLSMPFGLAADRLGNVFIANPGFSIIQKLSPAGTGWTVMTIAGQDGQTGAADGIGAEARFSNPQGLAVDDLGNVFVADSGNSAIRKLTPTGTDWNVTTIASVSQPSGNPALDRAGNIYVASSDMSTVLRVSPVGANWVTNTIAGSYYPYYSYGSTDGTDREAKFYSPAGILAARDKNIYLADQWNHTIRQLSPAGTNWVVSTIAGLAGAAGNADGTNSEASFNRPSDIAEDAAGTFYVTDSRNNSIRKLQRDGTNWIVSTVAGQGGFADGTNGLARFREPSGVTVDPAGILHVADSGNHLIRKVRPEGTNWVVSTIAGLVIANSFSVWGSADGTNTSAGFHGPSDLVMPEPGTLFVADRDNGTVRKMTLWGTNWVVTTIAGLASHLGSADGTNSDARFRGPTSLAFDGFGNLYVADQPNHTIRKVTPVGTNWVVTTIGGLAGNDGNADGVGPDARFTRPWGIAVDESGNLFVADTGNNVVRLGLAHPALKATSCPNGVLLSWPEWAGGFRLETSSTLQPGAAWTPLDEGAPGSVLLTNIAGNRAGFFRLRRPAVVEPR